MTVTTGTDLVSYSTATHLATVYAETTTAISEALKIVQQNSARLKEAYRTEDCYINDFEPKIDERRIDDEHCIEALEVKMRQTAWRVLVRKLEIHKFMSTKRSAELTNALNAHIGSYGIPKTDLPPITADTIEGVLKGYIASAEEFFHEKIAEEFDWWRPGLHRMSDLKTNAQSDRINEKVIKGYCVRVGYGSNWDTHYGSEPHLIALDSIFHVLDGKGPVTGYKGPLVDAIRSTDKHETSGETEYFEFKCFRNGNLHLKFKRRDLLAEFNRLGAEGSHRVGRQAS